MLIKVSEVTNGMMAKVKEAIQYRIWDKDVVVKSYTDSMREAYSGERRMRNTVIIGCVVSILIALFGLIGYVRDESQRRSKEMAVRKINGATVRELVGIYVAEIMKLSIPAIILGNVGAYFAASAWLKNFSEKIAAEIDDEVRAIIESAISNARYVIRDSCILTACNKRIGNSFNDSIAIIAAIIYSILISNYY